MSVQVITYAPTVFRHCQHCEVAFEGVGLGEKIHRAEARDALPDDLLVEYQRVSDWVHDLIQQHPGEVAVSLVDAASIEGVWRSLRHGIRRYPAVVVDGRDRHAATDLEALTQSIEARLSERRAPETERSDA